MYKSLNDFDDDSNGLRGDIDILVERADFPEFERVLKQCNFLTVTNPFSRKYYIGYDIGIGRWVILDVSSKIPAGIKPFKRRSLNIDTRLLKKRTAQNGVKMLDWCDYLPLMFILRLNALTVKDADINELKSLLSRDYIKPGYLAAQLEELSGIDWTDLTDSIKSDSIYTNCIPLRKRTSRLLSADFKLTIKSHLTFFYRAWAFLMRHLGRPQFVIKGRAPIIAVMGVDGAGKSSAIEYLKKNSFLKIPGVRFCYMGHFTYWIPGMNRLISLSKKGGIFKKIAIIAAFLDKRMRTLFMIYHSRIGNVVIADRYFYDEMVSRAVSPRLFSPIRRQMHRVYDVIFNKILFLHPDVTIYLDVSPEMAFARKQDYEFAKVKKMIAAYREFFDKHPRVALVNADESHETVKREIMKIVLQEVLSQGCGRSEL